MRTNRYGVDTPPDYWHGAAAAAARNRAERFARMAEASDAAGRHVDADVHRLAAEAARRTAERWAVTA